MITSSAPTLGGQTSMTFPAGGSLYILNPAASKIDIRDQLEARISHLEALLTVTYGDAGGTFREMGGELRGNYMWACASILDEVKQLSQIAWMMERAA